jgi:SSS family solute:Na+ symporter
MPTFELHWIDVALVGVYLVFIVHRGVGYLKKTTDEEEYFLGGRSFAWYLVGVSLFASNMSSSSLVGLASGAYHTGISVYNYEWVAAVVLVFFSFFMLPRLISSRVFTTPEFLERRYDRRARLYFAGLTLLSTIVVDTAGSLYAGGVVAQMLIPGVELWEAILALALLAGAYTVAGGLRAVVHTDLVQGVLLTFAAAATAVVAFGEIGDWETIRAAVPPEALSLVRPLDDDFMPWLGLVVGVPVLGFYFWCANQFMAQRMLGAKDERHARRGALFAGWLKLPVIFIMVIPGLMGRVLYPDLENPDAIFPTMLFDLLPVGAVGLATAGLLAAIMSSVDSTLNSASTLVTMDFYRARNPNASRQKLTLIGRITTFAFMALAAAWAPQIVEFPSLFHYLQNVLAFIAPPIVALFVVGTFWRRANATGAFASIVVGAVVGVAGVISLLAKIDWFLVETHFLYTAGALFALTATIHVVVSALSAPPDAKRVDPLVWSPDLFRRETLALRAEPFYANYRYLSAGLLAAAGIIVALFL